ncbi:MAG: hypothetical protein JWP83_1514 [Mycobacterium sp.]|uniref:hypothetical protein n=1 Tax=Mycobacterium sp. TaxID=1785 RepID=UPI00345B64E3|nr:hypothetical protein [Mycobacterium sp.]
MSVSVSTSDAPGPRASRGLRVQLHCEIFDAATKLMPETGNAKAVFIRALAHRRCTDATVDLSAF